MIAKSRLSLEKSRLLDGVAYSRPSVQIKKSKHKGACFFYGLPEGTLHLLSKAPPELSPKFPPAAVRHAKFGATFLVPPFKLKKASTKVLAFLMACPKGLSTCYRKLPRSFLPNFRQPLCGTRNSEPRFSSLRSD